MECFYILSCGQKYALVSLSGAEAKVEADDFDFPLIVARPSTKHDFFIELGGSLRLSRAEYYSAALAFACFIFEARGLPLAEIELETPSGELRVERHGSKLSLNTDKCKYSFTNKASRAFGCDFSLVSAPEASLCFLRAESLCGLSPELLRAAVAQAPPPICIAAAFSEEGVAKRILAYDARGAEFCSSLAAALAVAQYRARCGIARFGAPQSFELQGGELVTVFAAHSGADTVVAEPHVLSFRKG